MTPSTAGKKNKKPAQEQTSDATANPLFRFTVGPVYGELGP